MYNVNRELTKRFIKMKTRIEAARNKQAKARQHARSVVDRQIINKELRCHY